MRVCATNAVSHLDAGPVKLFGRAHGMPQNFSCNLTNAVQALEVIFCLVEIFLELLQGLPACKPQQRP